MEPRHGSRASRRGVAAAVAGVLLLRASPAAAQVALAGYVEAYGQWNANSPSNGITNFRGFDNRHASLTLANAVADLKWGEPEGSFGRVTAQVGSTGATYYASEPRLAGTTLANGSNAELWRYLQQAYVGQTFDVGRGLTVVAGLLLAPLGPETMPVRDSMNWSRSNLFFALPFYQTGVRASTTLAEGHEVSAMVFNGWNSVVDNNTAKSVALRYATSGGPWSLQFVYFGGHERAPAAIEGRSLRHTFDAVGTWKPTPGVELAAHANAGFEPSRLGVAHWRGGALYGRLSLARDVFLAVRTDALEEHVPVGAAAMVLPVAWVASQTVTLDYRPHARTSIRLEGRDDRAASNLFFGGDVSGDGVDVPFVPNRRSQQTLTLGMTTWF